MSQGSQRAGAGVDESLKIGGEGQRANVIFRGVDCEPFRSGRDVEHADRSVRESNSDEIAVGRDRKAVDGLAEWA